MTNPKFRLRWLDGRMGHTMYLMFFVTLANFILITYRFLIEEELFFSEVFAQLWVFSIVLIITYIPLSIIIGHWHRKTQLKVEMDLKYLENPLFAKMFRIWLDGETNNSNKQEIDIFVEKLKKIEKNK